VTVYEAKTHLSRLLDEVEAGGEVVVTRNGVPCAKVVPMSKPRTVPLGFVKGRIDAKFFEPLPQDELAAWEESTSQARKRRKR